MTSPLLALRAAILARLSDDPALAALMGGAVRLFDEPPRGTAPVYALFGNGEARDASVDGARRHAHTLALVVHGRPGSARGCLEAAERIAALIEAADLVPAGHALITQRVVAIAAARDPGSGQTSASLTIEAITEEQHA